MRAKIQKFVTLSSLGICFLTVCILWYGIERTPGQLLKNSKEQLSSSSRRSNDVVNQAKSASECSEFQKELLRTGFTYPGCHSRYSTFYLHYTMCKVLEEVVYSLTHLVSRNSSLLPSLPGDQTAYFLPSLPGDQLHRSITVLKKRKARR